MDKEMLRSQIQQFYEDLERLLPTVGQTAVTLESAIKDHYNALREEVTRLLPENAQGLLPPMLGRQTTVAAATVELYALTGQLLALLDGKAKVRSEDLIG